MKDITEKYYGNGKNKPQIRIWLHSKIDGRNDCYVTFVNIKDAEKFKEEQKKNRYFYTERNIMLAEKGIETAIKRK